MKNKGFTLIEIIIVIVIIGVMAGLALPKMADNISKGKAPEALGVMGQYMREIDMAAQLSDVALTAAAANQARPANTANFSYTVTITSIRATCLNCGGTLNNNWIRYAWLAPLTSGAVDPGIPAGSVVKTTGGTNIFKSLKLK